MGGHVTTTHEQVTAISLEEKIADIDFLDMLSSRSWNTNLNMNGYQKHI